jgi:hypothetical protein
MATSRVLAQRTSYIKLSSCAVQLPFVSSLLKNHIGGSFSLVENPTEMGRACIIGMFVLRPATKPLVVCGGSSSPDQILNGVYGDHDWVYNVKGIDGGRLISNNSVVDAYR